MARGINKVILIGNLGADPEVRYTPAGSAIANLRLATSDSWRDKQTGEMQDRTEWHRVVCFNRLGEIAGEYLRKGSKVYIEGRIQTRKWQDNTGNERYTTEIVASELQMLDGRGGGGDFSAPGAEQQTSPSFDSNQNMNANTNASAPPPKQAAPAATTNSFDDFDDDIPF